MEVDVLETSDLRRGMDARSASRREARPCRVRMGVKAGVGVVEQLVLGPHAPSGFTELLDAAP